MFFSQFCKLISNNIKTILSYNIIAILIIAGGVIAKKNNFFFKDQILINCFFDKFMVQNYNNLNSKNNTYQSLFKKSFNLPSLENITNLTMIRTLYEFENKAEIISARNVLLSGTHFIIQIEGDLDDKRENVKQNLLSTERYANQLIKNYILDSQRLLKQLQEISNTNSEIIMLNNYKWLTQYSFGNRELQEFYNKDLTIFLENNKFLQCNEEWINNYFKFTLLILILFIFVNSISLIQIFLRQKIQISLKMH